MAAIKISNARGDMNTVSKNRSASVLQAAILSIVLLGLTAAASAEPAIGTPWVEPSTDMKFTWVPPGCFDMGEGSGNAYERPVRKVCVKGFYLGVYEVTQAQYEKITGKNPSNSRSPDFPVDSVNWNDAHNMAQKLSAMDHEKIRLPSEAEWEYACRAGGAHAPYCGDGRVGELAWYDRNSDGQPAAVGKKLPNRWGLYDMSGNVWEWTSDCWHDNYYGAPGDGSAWIEGGDCTFRSARGGSWGTPASSVRAAVRNYDGAGADFVDTGFRLLRE